MSLINYTNIGTTAQQFAALKNQIRNGKTFAGTTSTAWVSGNASFTLLTSIADFQNDLTCFRIKPDDAGAPWTEWHEATGDVITVDDDTVVLVDEDVIPDVYSGYVLLIEIKAAVGYARLATANTWNELNTAIKAPLYNKTLTYGTTITGNDTYTIPLSTLTLAGQASLNDYIGIDEDATITFTVNVPTAGAAVIDTKTISDLTYVSATASGNNYNLSLTGDLAVTFSTYGMVTSDISGNDLATSLTLPKLTVNSTPSISSNTASFNATNNGFITSGTTALTLNCYTGALEE